jgi:hypothetical protein
MARMNVYYEFDQESLKPVTIVITLKPGELDWCKEFIYVPIIAPFQSHMLNEMDLSFAATILLEDLTKHPSDTTRIGIFLPRIKSRYAELIDVSLIEHLVIRLADLEEVLQFDAKRYFISPISEPNNPPRL